MDSHGDVMYIGFWGSFSALEFAFLNTQKPYRRNNGHRDPTHMQSMIHINACRTSWFVLWYVLSLVRN